LINSDKTTVQVLAEPGRAPTTKSYMWIFRGGSAEKPALVYLGFAASKQKFDHFSSMKNILFR
jgi:hypothetical protein